MRLARPVSLALLALLGLAWRVPSARADAIIPPDECPVGSSDAFCHGPATCAPRGCLASSECSAGEECIALSLCTETHGCFGFPATMVTHVLGACDAAGACAAGTCGSFFVCAPGPARPDAGTDAGRSATDAGAMDAGAGPEHVTYCGCQAPGSGDAGGAGAALVGLLGATLVARRRARRPIRAGRRCASRGSRSRRGRPTTPSRRS